MRRNPFEEGRFGPLRLPWWQAALLAALAVAAVLAVAIVAASLLLILVPLVVAALLVHRFLARRPGTGGGRTAPPVIDAEYEVIAAEPAEERKVKPQMNADERG